MRTIFALFTAGLLLASAGAATESAPDLKSLERMTRRFAPVEIKADVGALPANERLALRKLVAAARILDAIFLRQVAPLNPTYLSALLRDDSPLGRARLHYFAINAGPWSRLDEDAPFLSGVGEKPAAANFYPADATRAEVEQWLNSLAPTERSAAEGFFTTIRRDAAGKLQAVPYNLEYQPELLQAARLLRAAADATSQPTLKDYLAKRATAFETNDYYASDLAWMDLNAAIEPVIGPYEVYEDQWFNFKAAFEAFITLTDEFESRKLARFSAELQELEDHLPIDPAYRRPALGAGAPIRVANVVFTSGDANRGVQTAAYNLPNDERVVSIKGSKRVLLKNVQEAKFAHVLQPISLQALATVDQPLVAFEPFITHILMHELMHGLGPQEISVAGRNTTVRLELKELNGTLEEAKADISGLWALQYLMDKGVLEQSDEQSMYVTFLASTFRTLRFGLTEAHAKGMALQVNWLLDAGGFTVDPDGRFAVNFAKVKAGVTSLTAEIMTIQATGDYARGKALLDRLMVIRPEVKAVLDRLHDVPVDIEPHYVSAE